MPLLPTILADLPFGKPQRDYLDALLSLLPGLPVRPHASQPGSLRRPLSPHARSPGGPRL